MKTSKDKQYNYPLSHFLFIKRVKNQSEREVSARSGALTGLAWTERRSDFSPPLRKHVTACCERTAGLRLGPRPLSHSDSHEHTRTPDSRPACALR